MARNPLDTRGLQVASQVLLNQSQSFDRRREFEIIQALVQQQQLIESLREKFRVKTAREDKKDADRRQKRGQIIGAATAVAGGVGGFLAAPALLGAAGITGLTGAQAAAAGLGVAGLGASVFGGLGGALGGGGSDFGPLIGSGLTGLTNLAAQQQLIQQLQGGFTSSGPIFPLASGAVADTGPLTGGILGPSAAPFVGPPLPNNIPPLLRRP